MQAEEKGTVKSNDGEWCKRQVSGSYDDVIGQIQITKVLTLTFLMQIFSLPCQEFVYFLHCQIAFCLLCPNFKKVLGNFKGNKQK